MNEIIFKDFGETYNIENHLLRPLWKEKTNYLLLKDWNLFYNDFKNSINTQKKYIGIGHSIGGNIVLKTVVSRYL